MTVNRRPTTLTIDVIRSEPIKWGYCRGCQARVEWVTTVKGRHMPIDWPLTPLVVSERLDGSFVTRIDAAQSHFVTCPEADSFRKKR